MRPFGRQEDLTFGEHIYRKQKHTDRPDVFREDLRMARGRVDVQPVKKSSVHDKELNRYPSSLIVLRERAIEVDRMEKANHRPK